MFASHNKRMAQHQCQALVDKIRRFRTVVVDFDSTLTTAHGNLAPCARDVVTNARRLAVNTFNSEITPRACCTDKQLLSLGFCPHGKCRVPPELWADRRGSQDIVLDGRKIGTWHDRDIKGALMQRMRLDKDTTLFLDDNTDNVRADRRYGYTATKVDGRSGVSGWEEITPP